MAADIYLPLQALVLLDMEKVSAALVTSVSLIVLGTAAASYGETCLLPLGIIKSC